MYTGFWFNNMVRNVLTAWVAEWWGDLINFEGFLFNCTSQVRRLMALAFSRTWIIMSTSANGNATRFVKMRFQPSDCIHRFLLFSLPEIWSWISVLCHWRWILFRRVEQQCERWLGALRVQQVQQRLLRNEPIQQHEEEISLARLLFRSCWNECYQRERKCISRGSKSNEILFRLVSFLVVSFSTFRVFWHMAV